MKASFWAVFVSLPICAQSTHIKLEPAATKINFTLGATLHTVSGFFQLSKGELWFDPSTGAMGGLLAVKAASGDSGNQTRDSRMENNVLEARQYPGITFTPDHLIGSVNLSGDSTFSVHGLFAIHGASHELSANVKSHIDHNRITAKADFEVPYVGWGLKDPSNLLLKVAKTIKIDIVAVGEME